MYHIGLKLHIFILELIIQILIYKSHKYIAKQTDYPSYMSRPTHKFKAQINHNH